MISKLTLKNFQSHKHTALEFHSNFNVIQGSTNSGKSSIVRALGFMFYNEPWIKSFIRTGADRTELEAVIDDTTMLRVKSSKDNYVTIYKQDKKSHYDNFGKELPVEVLNAIGIKEIGLSDNLAIKLNVAFQHDSLFLIEESGSVRAKFINHLTGIHIFDNVLQGINKDQREISLEKNIKTRDLENAKGKLKLFDGLDDKLKRLEAVQQDIENVEVTMKDIDEMEQIIGKIKSWKMKRDQYASELEKLEVIDYVAAEQIFDVVKELQDLEQAIEQKNRLLRKQAELKQQFEQVTREYEQMKGQYEQELREQKICPICQTPLSEDKVHEVVAQI